MTTRAATFSAKIRTLNEFHSRISSNQQPPSSAEILTTLRYFQQTLNGFIKEITSVEDSLFQKYNVELQRSNVYPNLNYTGVYYGIVSLLDVFPMLPSSHSAIGDAILDTLKALYLFLHRDLLEQLPYLLVCQLGVFPTDLDKKTIHLVCDCLIPYIIDNEDWLAIPAILMLVLQHTSDPSFHTLLVESLMARRKDVYKDMILVLAKGTSEARIAAANLLFHYWPLLNPQILNRRTIQYRVHAWSVLPCQNLNCTENSISSRICYNPTACFEFGDTAPPMLLCKSCADSIQRSHNTATIAICNPMPASDSVVCQNKGCEAGNRFAVGTCFSEDCIRSHQYTPLRLCQECFTALHVQTTSEHILHSGMTSAWGTSTERSVIEAVVKLLKETSGNLEGAESEGKRPKWLRQLEGGHSLGREIDKMADERRMLSRFGIWLMAALCSPIPEAHSQSVGYIVSMLFQWFATTALLPNDSMGAALEQLKTDFAADWINLAISNHSEVFLQSLMPNPPDYAQVGGVWDKLSTKKEQMREGLNKLLAIMPYDIITLSTWNVIMPQWLQAICEQMSYEDCSDFKVLLSKIFEPDLCPLPFDAKQIYEFITERLFKGDENEIYEALNWLHTLSLMEISIPLSLIIQSFTKCAERLSEIELKPLDSENDLEEEILAPHITIMDIIALQMKINELGGQEIAMIAEDIFLMFSNLLQKSFARGKHTCDDPETDEFLDCIACQQSAFVYQSAAHIIEVFCPRQQMRIITDIDEHTTEWTGELSESTINQPTSNTPVLQTECLSETPVIDELKSVSEDKAGLHYQTAMVEEENMEFVGVLPSEEVEVATVEAVTLTETDVGRETCHVVTSSLVENVKGIATTPLTKSKSLSEFWDTSVGRFRFTIDSLPPHLRLINSILMNFDSEPDVDVQFYMLSILKLICLHCEALSNARREHRGFLIWAQENLLIPKLWKALKSDRSQLGEIITPLVMHCITLPCGEEVFWKIIISNFTDGSWQQRCRAVERMSILCQMVSAAPVSGNKVIQTSLSCGIVHLIASVNDPDAVVAQRAIVVLRALSSASLKLMCLCLESQFDSSIVDRALIVNRIQILTAILPDEQILSWDFFIQRFESLALESQLQSKGRDSSSYVHDLIHSDPMSDLYQRKLNRARQAIESAVNVRSIVRSLQGSSMRHHLSVIRPNSEKEEFSSSHTYSSSSKGSYGRLREFIDEESNTCLLFNRVVDMENPERHIVYLIVSLFVAFLCNNKKAGDEKATAKKQSMLLRHFNTLIGYSNSEKCFTIPPRRLRKSAVCNAFISGLPQILDSNLQIANQIVMLGLQLLIHLPSPQRLASDQPMNEYSLISLDISVRHFWLNTIILILYKYRYETPPMSDYVKKLIYIILCTIESQVHICESPTTPVKTEYNLLTDSSDSGDEESESTDTAVSQSHRAVVTTMTPQVFTIVNEQGVCVTETAKIMMPTIITVDEKGNGKLACITEEESENAGKIERHKGRKRRRIKKPDSGLAESCQLRCSYCDKVLETYDEETLSLSLIALETFLYREPAMAATLLYRIISTVTKLIDKPIYPWHDTTVFVAGNSRSVAKQLIRVLLHQMSTSGICLQLFNINVEHPSNFWATISFSLADFPELNPVSVIQILLEDILEDWPPRLSRILYNLAEYIEHVSPDAYFTQWNTTTTMFDNFFRRLSQNQSETNKIPIRTELKSCIAIMSTIMRVQNFSTFKNAVSLVEGFSRWMIEAMHDCKVELHDILTVCTACNRALIRERDKQCLSKAIVSEFVQAIKFKCTMNEHNYLTVIDFVLQDAGENVSEEIADDQFNTSACEAVRQYIMDILDFISDLHVLAKLKKMTSSDKVGGDVKASLAQVVAIEISRTSAKDVRKVTRFIPWLMSPPSVTQQAPSAFAEAVTNVRLLSWLFLGALHATQPCLPIPIECSQYMADYIHFVLAGFADQSKQSVVHMSALFHAFHLCQLWTVYCEQAALSYPEIAPKAIANALDFWSRVTPAILQLLSHSKVLADMVNLHFLNTMQALQQCNSAVLCQLSAMWQPILTAYHGQIPSQLRMKLDSCENQPSLHPQPLSQWLKGVRYKISQIELQTAAASPYYNV